MRFTNRSRIPWICLNAGVSLGPRSRSRPSRPIVMAVQRGRIRDRSRPVCCSSCLPQRPICCSVNDLYLTHAVCGGTGLRALPASLLFIWKYFKKRYCFYFLTVFNRSHEQHTQTSPQQQQPQREPDARHVRGPPPTGRTRLPLQTGTLGKVTRDGNHGRTRN